METISTVDLSIIIVNWNTRQMLENCLVSIFANPPDRSFEVWVVDNSSSDGSSTMVQEHYPQVFMIHNSENRGFASANNQAIRQSKGRYVLLLNPDTTIKSEALTALIRFMESSEKTGAAGARLQNPDGSLQISCHPSLTLFREFWRLSHLDSIISLSRYAMNKWDVNHPREVDVLMGACLVFRRTALDQVGLLDEDYFMYSEEVDLCHRVKKAGWKLFWVPQSEVVHYGGQSTRQTAEKMFLQLYRSKVQYFRKNHGGIAAQLYKWILLVTTLGRLILTPFALIERPVQREKHFLISRHYRKLLVSLPDM